MAILTVLAMLTAIIFLALLRSSVWGWLLTLTIFICIALIQGKVSSSLFQAITILLIPIVAIVCIPRLRRPLVTRLILKKFRQTLPHISQTEQDALDAGTVWWDGDLFSGHPNWQKLLCYPKATLNATEQSFLDNETESLCAMLDDWDITHVRYDLPLVAWEYIKKKWLFRYDYSERARWARIFCMCALSRNNKNCLTQHYRFCDRHGSKFLRPSRITYTLRHIPTKRPISS